MRGACPDAALIFDAADLRLLREMRQLAEARGVGWDLKRSWADNVAKLHAKRPGFRGSPAYLKWKADADAELGLANASDAAFVASPAERELLAGLKASGELRRGLPLLVVTDIRDAPPARPWPRPPARHDVTGAGTVSMRSTPWSPASVRRAAAPGGR